MTPEAKPLFESVELNVDGDQVDIFVTLDGDDDIDVYALLDQHPTVQAAREDALQNTVDKPDDEAENSESEEIKPASPINEEVTLIIHDSVEEFVQEKKSNHLELLAMISVMQSLSINAIKIFGHGAFCAHCVVSAGSSATKMGKFGFGGGGFFGRRSKGHYHADGTYHEGDHSPDGELLKSAYSPFEWMRVNNDQAWVSRAA